MVLSFILEAITISTLGKMWHPVNGSNVKSEALTKIYVSQMVLTFISEVITICAVIKMKGPVNSYNIKFGSVYQNICFLNGSNIHIGRDYYFHTCQNVKCD